MDYRQAKKIRQRSLGDVIAANIVAGESTLGAFGKGISQKTRARFTAVKEKFDPLNIVKFMTGGSRLAPALLGRMLGRSQRDIEYFAGTARPLYAPKTTHSRLGGLSGDESNLDILTKMYGFLKKTQDEEMRRFQLKRNYQEENQIEDEKRHKELIKALGGKTTTAVVTKSEDGGLFGFLQDFIEKFKPMLEFFQDMFQVFKKVGLQTVMRLFSLLGNPAFLMVAAGVATIVALRELLFKLADITPDMKALSPEEAEAALRHGSPKQIEDLGGRAYLEDVIKNQRQRAVDALAMPEGEERDKAIRNLGGIDKVNKMVEDTKVYEVPQNVDAGPEKVSPRPKTGGVALKSKQDAWDKNWGKTHDPETGVRKDLLTPTKGGSETPKLTPQQIESNVKATPETPTTAGQTLSNVTKENLSLSLKKKDSEVVSKTVNTLNQSKKQAPMLNRLDKLSVRNPDETFQKMILYSTRVV